MWQLGLLPSFSDDDIEIVENNNTCSNHIKVVSKGRDMQASIEYNIHNLLIHLFIQRLLSYPSGLKVKVEFNFLLT